MSQNQELENRRESQDERLIEALAAGRSYPEAGALAGVSGRTVARRMTEVSFARRVADRRGEQVVAIAGRITSLASEAVDAVRDCLDDPSARVRLAAARLLLDWALKVRQGEDLALAVAEIRQHLGLGDGDDV